MKGILLAGGAGTRLHPVTRVVSKQLLPVYDKPMIYYPVSTLMLAGIREVLLISTPHDLPLFRRLFGDGSALGMSFSYAEQPRPEGLAQAFLIGRDFVAGKPSCLALGDNIFFGNELGSMVKRAASITEGASVFGCPVKDPERYGVVEFDALDRPVRLVEKPKKQVSKYAVPGLYFYGAEVCDMAASLRPSERGELEITDLNQLFLERGALAVEKFGRGMAWFDTGTHRSLLEASNFIATVQERQGLQVACLEEIAFRNGWIEEEQVRRAAAELGGGTYADYLRDILNEGL